MKESVIPKKLADELEDVAKVYNSKNYNAGITTKSIKIK